MTDAFAVLGLMRRPALNEDQLTASYLGLAQSLHPDSPGGEAEKFAEVKKAFDLLKDPARRLRHLVELETGEPLKQVAPTVADALFSAVCATTETSRSVLAKAAASKSPLVQALMVGDLGKAISKTESLLLAVAQSQRMQSEELMRLDSEWPKYSEAATLAANMGFLAKCRHQLDESLFELTQVMRSFHAAGLSRPDQTTKDIS